jgi:Lrp/AsnC family leucine-responsive transcriptional regulator
MRIKPLDRVGQKIITALVQDARLPFREIGRQVGLTGPAVAERVRQMEDTGLIRGYHAEIDPQQAGCAVQAFIRLRTAPEHYPRLLKLLDALPDVIECHHVTGEDAFYLRVAAQSTSALEQVIARLSPFGATATAIILSTPLQRSAPVRAEA